MTPTTIVVPLDGSDAAERAVPVATWLARELGVDLRLMMTSFAGDVSEEEAYLSSRADATGLDRVQSAVLRKVFPPRGIVETVDGLDGALLCLTTRGRGALAEMFLGSVSDEVVREVAAPVVLVGASCRPSDTPDSREMVVSVDGSAGSLDVVPVAASLALALQLHVHIITVEPVGLPDEAYDPEANDSLSMAAALLEAHGVKADRHVVSSSHPADTIVGFAAGLHAALLVMGTHGQSGLTASALGSVATHVVRHASCPVLTRRPRD